MTRRSPTPEGFSASAEQPSQTADDLAEAAQSVATQQRDLVDRLRVDPADLRQEVRQADPMHAIDCCGHDQEVAECMAIRKDGES